jgi:hypothetical protein
MFGLSPKKLFSLALLAVGVFVGVQYARVFLTKYQFGDAVRQSVKFAGSSRKDPEKVRTEILEKAEELEIAIERRDIQITKRGPSFTVDIAYEMPVNLRVYEHVLKFEVSETGEIFGK